MKYLISIFVFLFMSLILNGQDWKTIVTGVSVNINSVTMCNRNTGWVIGDNGTILKTTDGGFHWTGLNSGISSNLKDVTCYGEMLAWATGIGGIIIHTSDGGQTWAAQSSGVTSNLNAIYFNSSLNGWACGADNTLVLTSDGGNTWTKVNSAGLPSIINDVCFKGNDGWLVANGGIIYCSTDGGLSWTQQVSPTTQNLLSVFFTSAVKGWISGYNGTVLHTSNGGLNWTTQATGTTNALLSVSFADDDFGITAGNGGVILKTENGGNTWTSEASGSTLTIRSSTTASNRTCWAAGNSGTILRQSVLNQICMVTVDTLTGKNKIIWDKIYDQGTESIKIYRLNGSVYQGIATIPFGDLSEYIDITSTPGQVSSRYKISAVDSSGNESLLSPYHQTINLTASQGVPATSVSLAWNTYEDESGSFVPAEYFIWRGTVPSSMLLISTVPSSVGIYNDENVFTQYYYYVTVEKTDSCISTGSSKETGGPYSSSFSNMEENQTGIEENFAKASEINVFPNPSEGSFSFELPVESQVNKIILRDISGKTIPICNLIVNGRNVINADRLDNGYYFLEIISERLYRSSVIINKN